MPGADVTGAEVTGAEVTERLHAVRARIEAAGGSPDQVTIVAVTKGFGPEVAVAALAAGLADLGENYAQELLAKHAALASAEGSAHGQALPAHHWHFLGHVQRNKVRDLADLVELWQGVDRAAAGAEIARRAPGAAVLVQVNVSGEAAKNGCAPADADGLVDALRQHGLDVRGLMAVGARARPDSPPEAAAPGFRLLAAIADRLGLTERSMGMSDDVEVAVGEGSTMLRVGRALFGPRSSARSSKWPG